MKNEIEKIGYFKCVVDRDLAWSIDYSHIMPINLKVGDVIKYFQVNNTYYIKGFAFGFEVKDLFVESTELEFNANLYNI